MAATVQRPSAHWREHLEGSPAEVSLLAVAQEGQFADAGWCTHASNLEDAPDVEIMCGGWNSKLPTAAAVWRQGNLLHFGFEQSPAQLNEAGCALLENSIHYIARFTEDRPIGGTVSGFSSKPRAERRVYLESVLRTEGIEAEDLAERFFSGALRAKVLAMDDTAAVAWIRERVEHMVPGPDGKLFVAGDLARLGVDIRAKGALAALRAALAGDGAADAVRALSRHVGSGPADGDAAAWSAYLDAESRYLFFSDVAGCAFLLDPLAKERGVASAQLRGPSRGDR